jgi:ankyrin repeat protein
MRNIGVVIEKAVLLVAILLLPSCATMQWRQINEGQVIDVGTYSVKAPLGEGWQAAIIKEEMAINFMHVNNKALGASGGGTIIKVKGTLVDPAYWSLSEGEIADNVRNHEVRVINAINEERPYKLEDVKMDVTTVNGRKLYLLSYKVMDSIGQEAILYLYFPPDFKKFHILYLFQISEFLSKFSMQKTDLAQINPVLASFITKDPLDSLTGINGELIKAAERGNIAAVKDLLDKRADVNAGSEQGSALTLAAFYGHLDVVRFLLDKGADINRPAGRNDDTALMSSILGGEADITRLLIDKGSNINARTGLGNTALMAAVLSNDPGIVRLLVNKGADINVKNNMGITALIIASHYDRIEITRTLIEKGADINAQQKDGWTALMNAIDEGHIEIAKFLVEKGADVNLKSKNGWTALHAVAYKGPAQLAKLLIEKGADINAKDNHGQTALMKAKFARNTEIVKLLKEAGAQD